MKELVFLLEEPSAKAMLEALLPRFLHEDTQFRCIPFEGKQDLERQLTHKIRAYQNNNARFIVLRDQDNNPDCVDLKRKLLDLCNASGKAKKCLVRIACKELETFYLADLQAVEHALEVRNVGSKQQNRKFRNPDNLGNPSQELRLLTSNRYEKVAGSREIGKYLKIENERSTSFRNLILAIQRMERELLLEHV